MSTFGCPRIFSLNAFAANPRWRARAAHAKCERNTRAIRRNTDSTVAGDCLTSLLCLWAAAANRASARIAAKAPLPGGEAELTFGAHFSAPNNDNSCPMTFFGKARNIFFIFDIGSVPKGRVSFSVQLILIFFDRLVALLPDVVFATPKSRCGVHCASLAVSVLRGGAVAALATWWSTASSSQR